MILCQRIYYTVYRLFILRRMKISETLVCQIKTVLGASKAERGKIS
jgi:hypothetical protein